MTQIFEWTFGEGRVRLEWPDGIKLPDLDVHLFPEDETDAVRAIRAFECEPPDSIGNSHRRFEDRVGDSPEEGEEDTRERRPALEVTVFSPREMKPEGRRHPWQERFEELEGSRA